MYPLAPYAISGVVWYQGESNTGNPKPYADYLKKLIGCWRDRWQNPQMPFVIAQLANYDGRQQTGFPRPITYQSEPVNSGWAQLREAQRLVAKADPYAELPVVCVIRLFVKRAIQRTVLQGISRRTSIRRLRLPHRRRCYPGHHR